MTTKITFHVSAVAVGVLLLLLIGGLVGFLIRGGGGEERQSAETEGPGPSGDGEPARLRFENPLFQARPGERALYRLSGGQTRFQEVRAVNPLTGDPVLFEEIRDEKLNKLIDSGERTRDPNYFLLGFQDADFRVVRLYAETVRVAGRDWPCVCVETVSRRLGGVRAWYSSEAPVTGLVKRQRIAIGGGEGLVLAEIVEWSGKK